MDSINRSTIPPSKSRLARTFAKVLHIRALTGVVPADEVHKVESSEEDEEVHSRVAMEAFLAKLFATISSLKSAYAQLQFAQSPYNAEGIQCADQVFVLMLKRLSELKQCYLKKHFDDSSPETTMIKAEIEEQKCVAKTYEITMKNLESQIKLKNSEITFLREKLEEVNGENKRLNSSGLNPTRFITALRQTIKSIRNFVRFMVGEMVSAGWDLDSAADSIEPGVVYLTESHKCFAFESFVSREMFDGFNHPNFSPANGSFSSRQKQQRLYFARFLELESAKPKEYLECKPKSTFAKFCREKYFRIIHRKMELSIFGDLSQRGTLSSGEWPATAFFAAFADMARRVWLLHCLAFSFDGEVEIFRVSKGSRFSEVYMEGVNEEAFLAAEGLPESAPRVAFTVVPGFKIGKTVIQCQVYFC